MTAKKEKPAAQLPTKKVYFPHLMLLYSIAIILVGAINLIGIYAVNLIVVNVLLILAGLWLLKAGFDSGFSKQRKEILKKYL